MAKCENSPMIEKGIKARIVSIMKEKGTNLIEVAQRIAENTGKPLVTNSSLSSRLRGNPSLSSLYEIADALGVRITDFFPDEPTGTRRGSSAVQQDMTAVQETAAVQVPGGLFGSQSATAAGDWSLLPFGDDDECGQESGQGLADGSAQKINTTAFCPHCGARVKVGVVLMGD